MANKFFTNLSSILEETKHFNEYISPDATGIEREFAKLKADNPFLTTEQLVQKIIHRQAVKCGIVGAITGLGGFLTLPIALPIDLILSLRLQVTMVEFIAATYGHPVNDTLDIRLRRQLIMSGSAEVAETTVNIAIRFLLRLLGKSLSKFVPLFGAVVSFAVNYAIMQGMGQIALRWYGGKDFGAFIPG